MTTRQIDTGLPLALALVGLVLALVVRLPGIDRSLGHDEVYTWVVFASRPLSEILSSYELPNNHIFHTLCVHLSAALFGEREWALRLPALAAGLLAVPALYGLARALAPSPSVAAWASLLLVLSSVHGAFSQEARGYTLLALFAVLYAWTLWMALESACSHPTLRRAGPLWALSALSGFLAMLTVPSAALLVGAGALSGAAAIGLERERGQRLRPLLCLLASSALALGLAAAVYLPHLDQVRAHAERFGQPMTLSAWPAFAAAVWEGIGPARWRAAFALVTAAGVIRLVAIRRANGVFLAGLLALPLALSLSLPVHGEPRVYLFLLPFVYLAVGVSAGFVEQRFQNPLKGRAWTRGLVAGFVVVALNMGFGTINSPGPVETGYRATGRWLAERTAAGDVVCVPYIMDSVIGYYSRGATVQRARQAVDVGAHRLLFVARPGTPRFALGDYMLATNFTTDEAGHADTHRNWRLGENGFRQLERFDLTGLYAPYEPPQAVDLGDLAQPDSWRVYYQSPAATAQVSTVSHPAYPDRAALRLRATPGQAVVLHSLRTASPAVGGLALLAHSKTGAGYASLYQRPADGDAQALQMATPFAAAVPVREAGDTLYAELYLCPVSAGGQYGVFVTSPAGGEVVLGDWALYFVALAQTPAQVDPAAPVVGAPAAGDTPVSDPPSALPR